MKAQHTITKIAQLLGRDKPTISRELRRNAASRGYRPKQACELGLKRSKVCRKASTVASWIKEQASALLRLQWSPEHIAGKLPVSHETLYLHVYADKIQGGSLWKNLRCHKQKRKRYASGHERRGQIPQRRPLSERPAHIKGRKQIGHWESDTVIGANHKQAIVSVVERKSGFAVICKGSNKTSGLVGTAIISVLKPFKARVKTLTYDNCKEFCGHTRIDQVPGSAGYFARPFASWERGSNENFNGLLRQYVRKKRMMTNITEEEIKIIENRLNNRPRKRLGLSTPAEVFINLYAALHFVLESDKKENI